MDNGGQEPSARLRYTKIVEGLRPKESVAEKEEGRLTYPGSQDQPPGVLI
jgi:hypothetical protein